MMSSGQGGPLVSWAVFVFGGICLMVGLAAFLGLCLMVGLAAFRAFRRDLPRQQEREHAERMKTLEMGFFVPPRVSPWPRTLACVSIGVLVPIGTFACAWITSLTTTDKLDVIVWGVTFLVSTTAIGCATSMGSALPHSSDRVDEITPTGNAKPPAFDPESFEAVPIHGIVNGSHRS